MNTRKDLDMDYDASAVKMAYNAAAEEEDRQEKTPSLRTELPRAFIQKYLQASDTVLDAGGGTGVNAIMMGQQCRHVTLLDVAPEILAHAAHNIQQAGVEEHVSVVEGDITNLTQFADNLFSFVVCVGDAISYVLDQRVTAIQELVRVAQPGAKLVIGCDSKYGFIRMQLRQGHLDKALQLYASNIGESMGAPTYLYTVDEMRTLLEEHGCRLLEVASTPTFTDTLEKSLYADPTMWERLKAFELEICITPELLGMGHHLLFVAQKREMLD